MRVTMTERAQKMPGLKAGIEHRVRLGCAQTKYRGLVRQDVISTKCGRYPAVHLVDQ